MPYASMALLAQFQRRAGRSLLSNSRRRKMLVMEMEHQPQARSFSACPFHKIRNALQGDQKQFLSSQAASVMSEALASSEARSSADTTTKAKPYTDIPGDWKSTFPLISALPLFIPYLHKETGGLLVDDFMRDYYNNYGKETGIARWGPTNERVALCFDEGYLEVFHREGKYPSGILTGAWPVSEYNRKYVPGQPQNPFLANGEDWRKGRMAINPYLFNIKEAQSYLPAINETVNNAIQYFEEYATTGKMDRFCELTAFDMFSAASLGLQINSVGKDPEGLAAAEQIIGSIATMAKVSQECPYSKYDALKFSGWDNFKNQWDSGRVAATKLVKMALEEGKGSGTGIMHGFLGDKDLKISQDEATEMYMMLTFAAADTTSSLINNVLAHLARNQKVQDKLRAELQSELGGQDYNAANGSTKLPYLEQILKENQRLTPSLGFTNVKSKIPRDLVINGYNVPAGTTVIFSTMGIANDERLAGPNPQSFDPDRFSPDNVAVRKGTRAEFLDHPVACKPFGFGARMCVGSRIAKLEYTALICRLIQDYKITMNEERSAPERMRVSRATTIEYPCPYLTVQKL